MKFLINKIPFLSKFALNYVYQKVAKKQYIENRDILENVSKWKNQHKGNRCFIIGTGPSLTIDDLEKLSNEITFGTNRIYELFNKTKWRPTYYINQDTFLIKTFSKEILDIDCSAKFIPVTFREIFSNADINFFILKEKDFYPKAAPFSFDVAKFIAQGYTVTYGAIQLAMYMGFNEIYLLGIDHNYNVYQDAKGNIIRKENAKDNYSKGMKEMNNKGNLPRVAETTIAYQTAEDMSKKKGVKIYNATRGGKLEVFERVNLDYILKNN